MASTSLKCRSPGTLIPCDCSVSREDRDNFNYDVEPVLCRNCGHKLMYHLEPVPTHSEIRSPVVSETHDLIPLEPGAVPTTNPTDQLVSLQQNGTATDSCRCADWIVSIVFRKAAKSSVALLVIFSLAVICTGIQLYGLINAELLRGEIKAMVLEILKSDGASDFLFNFLIASIFGAAVQLLVLYVAFVGLFKP